MTREEKAIAFVEDIAKYGFRIDTNPTRSWSADLTKRNGQLEEYEWWHDYVSGAERRIREAAQEALK